MIWILGITIPFVFLVILYLLGPKPEAPSFDLELPALSPHLFEISAHIEQTEREAPIRDDNHARIIWAGAQAEKSEYSLLYLHGFSSSQGDAKPVHEAFVERFSCNLYLPRLQGHGLDVSEPLLDFRADSYMKSAVEAYGVAKRIGNKVIIMGTSTGASLALYLAAHFPEIHALLLYSPNIELYDQRSALLVKPWGLQLARIVQGGKYRVREYSKGNSEKYWYGKYRLEALVELKNFLQHSMQPEIFRRVKQAVFTGYYYKNEVEQDQTVSVKHILDMFNELGSPSDQKVLKNFPSARDHCIASDIWSGAWEEVRDASFDFAEQILQMKYEK